MASQFYLRIKIGRTNNYDTHFPGSLCETRDRRQATGRLDKPEPGLLTESKRVFLAALFLLTFLAIPARLFASDRWVTEAQVDGDPIVAGLPYDAIPAINDPVFVSRAEAERFMSDAEPVVGVYDGKVAKAYPAWLLNGHEIVNDSLGKTPIAATW